MESDTPAVSKTEEEKQKQGVLPNPVPYTYLGKHRLSAAITHLNNKITDLQEELQQLETVGESSIVCRELVLSVESMPDPLLPVTKGPEDVYWDRWFQGAQQKRWI